MPFWFPFAVETAHSWEHKERHSRILDQRNALCYQSHETGLAKKGHIYRPCVNPYLPIRVGVGSLWGDLGCGVVITSFPPLGRAIHHVSITKAKLPKPGRTSGPMCSMGGFEGVCTRSLLTWSYCWLATPRSAPCCTRVKSWGIGHLVV